MSISISSEYKNPGARLVLVSMISETVVLEAYRFRVPALVPVPFSSDMHRSLCLVACFNVLLITAVAPAPESPSSFATFMDRNESTLLTSIISSINGSANTDPQEPKCLEQGEISHQMPPISIGHCYQLLTHLIARFSAIPVPWNTPEHPTPKLWTWGSCMISFEKRRPPSWDVFSELQVAKATAITIVKCVKEDTGWLGGQFAVGPRMDFWVTVFGRGLPLREMETA